jgi:hypothetical protein
MTDLVLPAAATIVVAVWPGAIVFQSFLVAPTVFKRLHGSSVALNVGVLTSGLLILTSMSAGVPVVDAH